MSSCLRIPEEQYANGSYTEEVYLELVLHMPRTHITTAMVLTLSSAWRPTSLWGQAAAALLLLVVFSSLLASAQSVELEEVYSVGDFYDVSAIRSAEDGSIYVADTEGNTVSRYDADGRLMRRIGGQGQGPGEFVGGPSDLALIASSSGWDVLVTDSRFPAAHRFDADLNFIGTWRLFSARTLDAGRDGRVYAGGPEKKADQTDKYVTVYGSDGREINKLGIDGLSENELETFFSLHANIDGMLILVFKAINRIDVRTTDGRLIRRLSIDGLPERYPGSMIDLPTRDVPELVAKLNRRLRYVPGGFVFTHAAADYQGHLFLQAGGKTGKMSGSRTVFVLDLQGTVKATFAVPAGEKIMEIDREGHLYTKEDEEEGTVVRKYKVTY